MKKLRIGQRLELKISGYAFGGKGIARLATDAGDLVVFVQNALPDQAVLARVVKSKKNYAECKLVQVLQRAPAEVDIPYQDIPGAPYAHLPLDEQKHLKRAAAFELYSRIGRVDDVESIFDEWIDAPELWHYRNKMEYSFSAINSDPLTGKETDQFSLGFKRRGSWWAVENLDRDSGLFDGAFENKLYQLREYLSNTGLPAWNPRKREGFFKNLIARKSFSQDQIMLSLVTGVDGDNAFDSAAFVQECLHIFGKRISGIFQAVNESTGDRHAIDDANMTLLYGQPTISEQLNDLTFEIGIKSFFQPNPRCAEKMYTKAMNYVQGGEAVEASGALLDLFCGTGTLTQLLGQAFPDRTVIGVDIEPSAVADARQNAAKNGAAQLTFEAGDVGQFLFQHPELKGQIAAALMDPPRSGIAPKTLRKVIRLGAKKLVYISCNPATQARDCQVLAEAGYQLKRLSFADQFPHTAHVEAVAVFERTDKNQQL